MRFGPARSLGTCSHRKEFGSYFQCIVNSRKGLKQRRDVIWFIFFKKIIGCYLKSRLDFPNKKMNWETGIGVQGWLGSHW